MKKEYQKSLEILKQAGFESIKRIDKIFEIAKIYGLDAKCKQLSELRRAKKSLIKGEKDLEKVFRALEKESIKSISNHNRERLKQGSPWKS
jgi:hypothetical protein